MLFDAKNVELDKVINQGTNYKSEGIEDKQKEQNQKEEASKKVKGKKERKTLKKLKVIPSKTTNEKAKSLDEPKKAKVYSEVVEVIPFVDVTEENFFELKNGSMEILQLESEDTKNKNEDDIRYMIFSITKFLRTYSADFKWVSMGFPVSTSRQLEYWLKKFSETDNPIKAQFIQQKINELKYLEENYLNRDYYLFLYSDEKTLDSLKDNIKSVKRANRAVMPLIEIPQEKKYQILYKMNNMNSKIKS
ncbi:hypothetical protein [Bacillus licheniformis]|uniref:hypothetical protein n=2 Tax=Bacillus licheniformis TaxID=1402 RepID=UPI00119D20A5|nr:hypothetical protein [Bacillus licheniformis]TWL14627.1 hypothetical protein CHCC16874_1671 [Bacillus licheniformis]